MKKAALLTLFTFLFVAPTQAQLTYYADILGNGFKQATIVQTPDYEGSVTCTLVRKQPATQVKQAILYVHGFNDYFFQQEMADHFIAQGFNFYAIDLRKCGRSWLANQRLGNVRNLAEYFEDIDAALRVIRQEGSEKILLSGHCLGGLTVSLYAASRNGTEKFDAILLNNPFFDLPVKSVLKKTGVSLALKRAEKHPDSALDLEFSRFYGESLHKDFHGEWNYNLSWKPVEVAPVTYGWIKAVSDGLTQLSGGLRINKPVLVLHSAKSVEDKKWSEAFFTGDAILNIPLVVAQTRNIEGQFSLQAIQNGMHDLMLSTKNIRDDVYAIASTWAKRNMR